MDPALRSPCVLLALAACIPPEPPPWVISEPTLLGVRSTVVIPGSASRVLLVPPGYHRADMLPGDGIELEWFPLAPPDITLHPPVWIVCPTPGFCTYTGLYNGQPLAACPSPLPGWVEHPCRLGVGDRISVRLADTWIFPQEVLAVGAWGDDLDAETCVQRLFREPRSRLERCLVAVHELAPGPSWWLHVLLGQDVPPELLQEPPDLHPELSWFSVSTDSAPEARLVLAGGSVDVRPGEGVTIALVLPAGSAQTYATNLVPTEDGTFSPELRRETLDLDVMLSADVDDFVVTTSEPFSVHWRAPGEPGTVDLHAHLWDTREGQGFFTLHVRAVDPEDP